MSPLHEGFWILLNLIVQWTAWLHSREEGLTALYDAKARAEGGEEQL